MAAAQPFHLSSKAEKHQGSREKENTIGFFKGTLLLVHVHYLDGAFSSCVLRKTALGALILPKCWIQTEPSSLLCPAAPELPIPSVHPPIHPSYSLCPIHPLHPSHPIHLYITFTPSYLNPSHPIQHSQYLPSRNQNHRIMKVCKSPLRLPSPTIKPIISMSSKPCLSVPHPCILAVSVFSPSTTDPIFPSNNTIFLKKTQPLFLPHFHCCWELGAGRSMGELYWADPRSCVGAAGWAEGEKGWRKPRE